MGPVLGPQEGERVHCVGLSQPARVYSPGGSARGAGICHEVPVSGPVLGPAFLVSDEGPVGSCLSQFEIGALLALCGLP